MPHKETLWSFYNVSHYTLYCFACEMDAQMPTLGTLLGNVKGYPIRESHTFSAEIFPAHSPPLHAHSQGFL